MSNKNKLHFFNQNLNLMSSKSAIQWILDVGYFYCTLTRTQAVQIARVDRSTFERWENGKTNAPAATLELLRLHAFGEPAAALTTSWQGWRFQHDKLINNDYDYSFSANDLQAVVYWQPYANKLAIENNGLRSQIKELKNDLSAYNAPKRPHLTLVINN